tara:strand:+ start:175 stop:711 length:537 start_codon:yes stop_codon:yes gene_type:complete
MATTIQNFFTRAASRQFSRDFLFRVKQIDLVGGISFNGEEDLVYARTASFPGRNIENKTVNYFGQDFQVPGRSTYPGSEGYSINFYHDEDCELRTKLEAASRAVFNNETSLGQYGMPGDESVINLVQIDKELNDVRNIELVGASIRDISPVEYDIAGGTGEVLNFDVTFAYHFYRDIS